ncbi:unnamed protein product [Brassica rapa subsp. narinosa]|uniref:(rape) hypothetical protein n=1 Tax=Brassica napus TaxID=3708 RepID=A0A816WQE0_BRANA|nr:unnamed protein product [Brassica napus]
MCKNKHYYSTGPSHANSKNFVTILFLECYTNYHVQFYRKKYHVQKFIARSWQLTSQVS